MSTIAAAILPLTNTNLHNYNINVRVYARVYVFVCMRMCACACMCMGVCNCVCARECVNEMHVYSERYTRASHSHFRVTRLRNKTNYSVNAKLAYSASV